MRANQYAIVVEKAGANYSAYVPDLPGCIATGATIKEARQSMVQAIAFHLEGLSAEGLPVPPASTHVFSGRINVVGKKASKSTGMVRAGKVTVRKAQRASTHAGRKGNRTSPRASHRG